MRNIASTDSTTVPSTIAASLNVDDPTELLSLSVLPRHDSIGVKSSHGTTQVCVNVKAADIEDEDRPRARQVIEAFQQDWRRQVQAEPPVEGINWRAVPGLVIVVLAVLLLTFYWYMTPDL